MSDPTPFDFEQAKKIVSDLACLSAHILLAKGSLKSRMSEKDLKYKLAIIAVRQDGTGQMGADFELDPFVEDLEKLADLFGE